ncbi:bromo-adjacent homology domain-containing family protein [Striga asiatica]|uniref:Bromo-adjacent homology domain-containing family protein n=1 Tax=Striga asiatica TaxID=4170 RepID=A0A5A7QNN3_STRAF|nr:bromo-adjacent homology domain-containing family protein [Striga asiatica]
MHKCVSRLFNLTDKDYKDNKQHEPEDAIVDRGDQVKSRRLIRTMNVSPLNVTRVDRGLTRFQLIKAETSGSACGTESGYSVILSNLALAGETQCDRWLQKLLQSIQSVAVLVNDGDGSENKPQHTAAHVVVTLETVAHETLSAEFHKYNQKMRLLAFTLKVSPLLLFIRILFLHV